MPAPDDDSRATLATWLTGPESAAAQAAAHLAAAGSAGDPIAAASSLRRLQPMLTAPRASSVLEQAELRRIAKDRYGIDAGGLLLTRDGLEQATRPEVAAHRARQIRAAGARRVIDMTAGLGFDTQSFLNAGLDVTAVERDPVAATFLAHNCPAASVIVADSTTIVTDLLTGLSAADVVFIDPARRDPTARRSSNLRALPERDPVRWSPPWPLIQSLPHPRIAAKVAPSFDAPEGWHAEWASVQRTLVECSVYSWPVFAAWRRAVMWLDGEVRVVAADDSAPTPPAAEVGAWLHEPDPAIVRSRTLAALIAELPVLRPVDAESTWLTSDVPVDDTTLRSFAVVTELVGSVRQQRRRLDALGVATLSVKTRDVDIAPAAVLHELDRKEANDHVLVVTRRSGRSVRFLCAPARRQSA